MKRISTKIPLQKANHGYVLVATILLGLAISIVGVTNLQFTAISEQSLTSQSYRTIAQEAARSGIEYASSCFTQGISGWTNAAQLKPNVSCSGAPTTGSAYLSSNPEWRSTFSVGQKDAQDNITSTGTVYVRAGGSWVKAAEATARAHVTATSLGPASKNASMVSTGRDFTCTVTKSPDSSAYCWGDNAYGQLGNNSTTDRLVPTAVYMGAGSPAVPSNPNPCDNSWWTSTPNCITPARPAVPRSAMQGKKVTKLSAGQTHACAVATDADGSNGRAYCWGDNTHGQLGNRSNSTRLVPVAVDTQPTDITPPPKAPSPCGGWFQPSCTPVAQPVVPKSASGGKMVVDITAGDGFTCALTSDGLVSCWGLNDHGQLGNDSRTSRNYPVSVSYGNAVVKTCVAWNFFGNCTNYDPDENIPASALQGKTVKTLARLKGTAATMCVITTENKTVCWGANYAGQVGDGKALPPTAIGHGSYRNNAGPCDTSKAMNEAMNDVQTSTTNYAVTRPIQVQTSLAFSELVIDGGGSTSEPYAYVSGKVSADSPSHKNRLFYWGGRIYYTEGSKSCQKNGSDGSDYSINKATAYRHHTGKSTPTGPLYNTSSDGELRNQLGLIAGDPVRGLFCATTLGTAYPNQPYCDIHDGRANEGQLGNNYTCSWFCSTWPSPVPVRTDLANDSSTSVSPDNIRDKQITSLDTSPATGFSCMVAEEMVYCWGVNSNGQIGDNSRSRRPVPTAAFYGAGSPLGIPGGRVTYGKPMVF